MDGSIGKSGDGVFFALTSSNNFFECNVLLVLNESAGEKLFSGSGKSLQMTKDTDWDID